MPSDKHLGAFDDLEHPVPHKYGDWSKKWENSPLRYEPPHRPAARLGAHHRPSMQRMKSSMSRTSNAMLGDPTHIYRLPGFNRHNPQGALKAASGGGFPIPTAFQTPAEARTGEHLRVLRWAAGGRDPEAAPPPAGGRRGGPPGSNPRRLDGEGGGGRSQEVLFVEHLALATEPLERRESWVMGDNGSETASLASSLGGRESIQASVTAVKDTLLRQAHEDASGGAVGRGSPPVPSSTALESAAMNGPPGAGVGARTAGGPAQLDGGDPAIVRPQGSLASVGTATINALEASGEARAYVPHQAMPRKPFQRFATYPPVAIYKVGLHSKANGVHAPPRPYEWPLDPMVHAGVKNARDADQRSAANSGRWTKSQEGQQGGPKGRASSRGGPEASGGGPKGGPGGAVEASSSSRPRVFMHLVDEGVRTPGYSGGAPSGAINSGLGELSEASGGGDRLSARSGFLERAGLNVSGSQYEARGKEAGLPGTPGSVPSNGSRPHSPG